MRFRWDWGWNQFVALVVYHQFEAADVAAIGRMRLRSRFELVVADRRATCGALPWHVRLSCAERTTAVCKKPYLEAWLIHRAGRDQLADR